MNETTASERTAESATTTRKRRSKKKLGKEILKQNNSVEKENETVALILVDIFLNTQTKLFEQFNQLIDKHSINQISKPNGKKIEFFQLVPALITRSA